MSMSLSELGAQMVTNQSHNMFSHDSHKIEIAIALQSFSPSIDL